MIKVPTIKLDPILRHVVYIFLKPFLWTNNLTF